MAEAATVRRRWKRQRCSKGETEPIAPPISAADMAMFL
ncbi:hypothetical protein A2U01_0076379, partial [Trifolium medium]|nr:hypothetical protein [Trifolium medium]